MNILHLTDWHLDSPNAENEPLCKNHFKDYIQRLKDVIPEKVDKIILTGDFINKSNTGNFLYVAEIFTHLAATFLSGVMEDIHICSGEHDHKRLESSEGYDRSKFEKFVTGTLSRKQSDSNCISFEDSNCISFEFEKDVAFLMFETTIELTKEKVTKIIRILTETKGLKYIVIGSHHPISPMFIKKDDELKIKNTSFSWFIPAHNWLIGEMQVIDSKIEIICLSGDTHYEKSETENLLSKKYSTIDYFSTPRFGSKYVFSTQEGDNQSPTPQKRGARLITLADEGAALSSTLFSHELKEQHEDSSNLADYEWKRIEDSISQVRKDYSTLQQECDAQTKTVLLKNAFRTQDPSIESIDSINQENNDESLQNVIKTIIKDKHLYKFGRHETTRQAERTALSWVMMTPLLGDNKIFSRIVESIVSQLHSIDKIDNENDVIILGLDAWGATIASHISVRMGIKNYCIETRVPLEINNALLENIQGKKNIVLIRDVVSSGISLAEIHRQIDPKRNDDKSWYLFSVICDERQNREGNLDFITTNYTVCNSLRMPLIKTELLPEVAISPIDLELVEQSQRRV